MESGSPGNDFQGLVKRYTLKAIAATSAKGNSKYILEDLFTDFGDEILTKVDDIILRTVKEEINEFRF